MKRIIPVLILPVLLLLSACGFAQLAPTSISPNAGAPDFLQGGNNAPWIGSAGSKDPCTVSTYEGNMSGPSDAFVLVRLGPCGWGTNQNGRYTLSLPIHIQEIHCWIGTSSNSRFETVANTQIWQPDSSGNYHLVADWICEFDKHQDITGNVDKTWTYPQGFDVPAGSVITTYRYPGGLIFCGADYWRIEGPSIASGSQSNPNGADPSSSSFTNCATEIHWRFYGTGK